MEITKYIDDYYYVNKSKSKSNYTRRNHEKEAKLIKNKIQRIQKKNNKLIERKKSKNNIRKYSDIH